MVMMICANHPSRFSSSSSSFAFPSTAVQGLRFSCYSWAPGFHSWTREPGHTVHVTDVYATESRTPPVRELSADRFSVGLLLHCSAPTQGQSRGMGKGVWRPCTTVLSCERGKKQHIFFLFRLQPTRHRYSLAHSTAHVSSGQCTKWHQTQ